MKSPLLLGIFVALQLFTLALSSNYVCPAGESTTTITIENGDVFSYKTQAGSKYEANVDCTVNYKMGETCKKIGFGCKKVVLKGKGKRCSKGDKMIISYGKTKKYFCGKKKVRVAAGGRGLRVQLLTDNRSGRLSGPGGVCRVKCIEGQASPSTTTSSPPTGDNVLEKISLEAYPLAQCNDKTAAVYYRHPEINQQSSRKMLIYLKGGGYCVPGDGPNNCNARCRKLENNLCTAKTDAFFDLGAEKLGGTICSNNATVNPAYHDFANVYVPYCSSDLYSGTANASDATEGRVFHGKYIFKAIIDDLLANTWLAEAEEVVLVGTSAGSGGVERNCDYLADTLKTVKADINVKCIMDGGSLLPLTTYAAGCSEYADAVHSLQDLWEPELDESCQNESLDPYECGSLTNSYKYVETPSMLVGSATDTFPLKQCGDSPKNETFLQTWREEMGEIARNITQDKPDFGFYIENCPFHTTVANTIYFDHKVQVEDGTGEINLRDLLANFQNEISPKVAIDNMDVINPYCTYFN